MEVSCLLIPSAGMCRVDRILGAQSRGSGCKERVKVLRQRRKGQSDGRRQKIDGEEKT